MATPNLDRINEIKRAEVNDLRAENKRLWEAWKETAIAWNVCASIHREYAKGKDPFYKTRQADLMRRAENARAIFGANPLTGPAETK